MELKGALNDEKMKPLVLQTIDYLVITYFEMLAAVIIATQRPDVPGGGGSQVLCSGIPPLTEHPPVTEQWAPKTLYMAG